MFLSSPNKMLGGGLVPSNSLYLPPQGCDRANASLAEQARGLSSACSGEQGFLSNALHIYFYHAMRLSQYHEVWIVGGLQDGSK